MNLPDGDYKGCVYISAGSVSDENDFDYGRKQFIHRVNADRRKV